MNYEKKYKEALEWARKVMQGKIGFVLDEVLEKFPELRESEDEKMMNQLHSWMKEFGGSEEYTEKVYNWLQGLIKVQCEQKPAKNLIERWKDMRLEVYQQASGNRHEPNYSDETTKMFSLNDIDEIIEKMSEQKPAEKVELKFKAGDWILHCGTEHTYQVVGIKDNKYQLKCGGNYTEEKCADVERCARMWDITKDAKDGDVLNSVRVKATIIFKRWNPDGKHLDAYCALQKGILIKQEMLWDRDFEPATKEQRDLLFQKMHEAGYEWDAIHKQLKEIEQNPAWSEEDEVGLGDAMWAIQQARTIAKDENDIGNLWCAERWLKSLKDRVQPQPKQEWREEDRKIIIELIGIFESAIDGGHVSFPYRLIKDYIRVLKSCLPQNTWKPSEEMLEALYRVIPENVMEKSEDEILLDKLYQGLKYGKVLSEK